MLKTALFPLITIYIRYSFIECPALVTLLKINDNRTDSIIYFQIKEQVRRRHNEIENLHEISHVRLLVDL